LARAINRDAHAEADCWRDWIKGYERSKLKKSTRNCAETPIPEYGTGGNCGHNGSFGVGNGEFEPIIREATKMFDTVTSDPQTQEFIRMREKELRDFNSAIGKKESALKLLSRGMSVEEIADITGLAESEIRKLAH
jgi:hypothetical protein